MVGKMFVIVQNLKLKDMIFFMICFCDRFGKKIIILHDVILSLMDNWLTKVFIEGRNRSKHCGKFYNFRNLTTKSLPKSLTSKSKPQKKKSRKISTPKRSFFCHVPQPSFEFSVLASGPNFSIKETSRSMIFFDFLICIILNKNCNWKNSKK